MIIFERLWITMEKRGMSTYQLRENCDIWQIAMNHRRDLCSVHKFPHWLLRKEKDVGT